MRARYTILCTCFSCLMWSCAQSLSILEHTYAHTHIRTLKHTTRIHHTHTDAHKHTYIYILSHTPTHAHIHTQILLGRAAAKGLSLSCRAPQGDDQTKEECGGEGVLVSSRRAPRNFHHKRAFWPTCGCRKWGKMQKTRLLMAAFGRDPETLQKSAVSQLVFLIHLRLPQVD